MNGDMGIFKRRDTSPAGAAISEFWEQWPQLRERIEASDDALDTELHEAISRLIHKIHPDLLWEIDAQKPSFTVTGGGIAELRGIAERWRKAAPRRQEWAFYGARQGDPEMLDQKLSLADHEFDLTYVKLGMRVDRQRSRIHISAYHPDFLFVDEQTQLQVAFHVLDWSLGEDDVARWIGEVTIAIEPPIDALPPNLLASVVEQVAEPFKEGAWLTGEGRTPRGHPARIAVKYPLHRQDFPLCDTHISLTLPYASSNPDRLPVEPSSSALKAVQGQLEELGAQAVLALTETGDGIRVFHLYADAESPAVALLDQLAASWPEGRAKVEAVPDPGWRAIAPYQP
ncbi:DUF695 domain-containing protein [Actinocorallia longicatena]|uniref:DUF695 domain-containing protein n=1 Tax=Actinocorallia longicatena TaxID=111803 RepID=A0ABP6Q0V3_9ACTN